MGSIFSAIGSGINAIISAIAGVVMTIVGAITTADVQEGAQVEAQGAAVFIRDAKSRFMISVFTLTSSGLRSYLSKSPWPACIYKTLECTVLALVSEIWSERTMINED
ncbi:hypothetical protein EDD22DRAFT_855353 [Suillus occidentalis]|nr:hypothetical protein EDD22DRAFT_855353 [Suillus occidentalis]